MAQWQPPHRFQLLNRLHDAHERAGWLSRADVEAVAGAVRIPLAEAWEAATSYPEFQFEAGDAPRACSGLSCVLKGAAISDDQRAGCRFRCFDAPVAGGEEPFPEAMLRNRGPLLAADSSGLAGLEAARARGPAACLDAVDGAALRGRGGAYFSVARKWRAALEERRPIALVMNAEEGEPGVFKDRALLCRRPLRVVEGLAIAASVLQPAVIAIFLNGRARPALDSLRAALAAASGSLSGEPVIVMGGGGYVLGEETTLLNALEGRKPVPRLRPPYPAEAGLFGMPTVVNNVETIANLSHIFRGGTAGAAPSKLFSVSGRVARPGIYEMPLGTSLSKLVKAAGGLDTVFAALVGGPSGGFLPAAEFHRALEPGLLHPTGAVTGSGGVVMLESIDDVRTATLEMARFNARESCGKCTPCREGLPRLVSSLESGDASARDDLLEAAGAASLCGLGHMAPGPIRSALHFWPELFS